MNDAAPSPDLTVWSRPFVRTHQRWCDDFVLELRLRDVPGPVVGDRLAEVEAHCTETGESPSEAFGDATGYASRIDEDGSPDRVRGVGKVTALAATQAVALLVGTAAVDVWATGGQLAYNALQVTGLVLFLLLLLGLPKLLRPLLRHPWAVGVPLLVPVALGGAGAALSGRSALPTVVQLPAPPLAVGLLVLVLVLARVEYRELARHGADDVVTSPLPPTSAAPASRLRASALLPASLIPFAYLALATVYWASA